eukprot:TRINITY_DN27886_c0_g1_i1.p1 TRINITY_DN27886_c0_g1~~TRINITY_DN27886_c0_g1_i1.p1  ORF type:complete len:530 (+),score=96.22 TRINITY_DN27886_c0_g1_i1:54-1592(+)
MAAFTSDIVFFTDGERNDAQWVTVTSWRDLLQNEGKYSVYWETKEEPATKQDHVVEQNLFSDIAEPEEEKEEKQENEEEGDFEGIDGSAYGAALTTLRKRNNGTGFEVPRSISASSQFKILLLVSSDNANKLCVLPFDETSMRFDLSPDLDEVAPEPSIYESGIISMIKSFGNVYPTTRHLFWSGFGKIKTRQEMLPHLKKELYTINVKYRVKLGVKIFNKNRFARKLDASTSSAIEVCNTISQTGQAGMQFVDSIEKSEHDFINTKLATHPHKDSESILVYVECRREKCRVTCFAHPVTGMLIVRKVKNNTQKYTVLDIIRPGRTDIRLDIRTTENVPVTSALWGLCRSMCEALKFCNDTAQFSVVGAVPQEFIKITLIRRKRKCRFVVPNVVGEGATKVSTSHVTQYDIHLPPRQLLSYVGPLPSSAAERFEAAAQLMSIKEIFDSMKLPNNLLNPNIVLSLADSMLPNTLFALQQIAKTEAVRMHTPTPNPPCRKEESDDDDMSSDDEV